MSGQMAVVKNKTQKRMGQVLQAIALEAYRRMSLRTPVKSGRARANWHIASGAPSTEFTEVSADGSEAGSAAAEATSMAIRAAATLVIVDKTFITNNVVYIRRLEHGWSQRQAPQGMAAITAAELTEAFSGILREVNKH